MKLPWVPRAEHEAVEREMEAMRSLFALERERYQALLVGWERRWDVLFQNHEKLLDRVLPVPVSPVMATPAGKRSPDVVQQTIRDESQGDTRLAGFLRKRARELKADGKAPEEIAAELSNWQTTESDGRSS